ncbi:MAG: serine/threonine-protein kinase [Polyangiales bacterium]
MAPGAARSPLHVGRYALYGEIASGGMATVHFGRLLGPVGFSRTVAVKRLHAHLAKDPEFVSMFLDEARLAARIRHPNVVPTLDVVALEGELFLVMEYVQGESLSRLLKAAVADETTIPLPIVAAITAGALHGLHAAHEATNERGEPLDLVHRDVSPQNVLVGVDGVPRVLDFGVAKAVGRLHTTRDGRVKGKIAYMAPEQLRHGIVDRRTDIYAAGVVLWEQLTRKRLIEGDSEAEMIARVLDARIEAPSKVVPGVASALDDVVMRALSKNPADRFGTARQMARAIEAAVSPASPGQVGEWVELIASDSLGDRERIIASIETSGTVPAAEARPPAKPAESEASQVSTISFATPNRDRKRSRLWIGFAAGLIVAGGAAIAVRTFDRKAPEPSPAVEVEPPASASASASATATASASVSATASASAPAPSATPSPAKIVHKSAPPKPPPASPACTVKSFVDGTGVKHYFNDCPKKP